MVKIKSNSLNRGTVPPLCLALCRTDAIPATVAGGEPPRVGNRAPTPLFSSRRRLKASRPVLILPSPSSVHGEPKQAELVAPAVVRRSAAVPRAPTLSPPESAAAAAESPPRHIRRAVRHPHTLPALPAPGYAPPPCAARPLGLPDARAAPSRRRLAPP